MRGSATTFCPRGLPAVLLMAALPVFFCPRQADAAPSAPTTTQSVSAVPHTDLERLAALEAKGDPQSRLEAIGILRAQGLAQEGVVRANRLILSAGQADGLPRPLLPAAFVERALCLWAAGAEERALEDLESALALDARNVPALMARGDLLFVREEPAGAEESYARAIAAQPTLVQGWVNRGVARDEQGRHQEAIADFTRALELDPSSASALANRGVSRSQAGDMDGMCRDYREACRLGRCERLAEARLMGYCAE